MILPFLETDKIITEGIIFLTYLLICMGLAGTHPFYMNRMKLWKKAAFCGGIFVLAVVAQGVLYFMGWDIMLILTKISITAYLPTIVIISAAARFSVYEAASVCAIGYLSVFILKMFKKIMYLYTEIGGSIYGIPRIYLHNVCLVVFSAILVFFIYRFLRGKFWVYIGKNKKNWMLLAFPVCMQFLQYSYFFRNSHMVFAGLLLQLFVSFSIFLIILRVMSSQVAVDQMEESKQAVLRSLDMQRHEYENICKKIEAGRAYRHNMRHHLSLMEELARRGDVGSLLHYIQEMGGSISETEWSRYCGNPIINAVFSSCVSYAKHVGCKVKTEVCIPEDISYNEIDICMILANTIENAVQACCKIPVEQERKIDVAVKFLKDHKLIFSVKNPCISAVAFNKDGLPDVVSKEGHGIGLKSVKSIVEKYDGLFQCSCSGSQFYFRAILFDRNESGLIVQKKPSLYHKLRMKAVNVFTAAVLMFLIITSSLSLESYTDNADTGKNLSGNTEDSSKDFRWGDTSFYAENPVLDKEELWDAPAADSNLDDGKEAEEAPKDLGNAAKETIPVQGSVWETPDIPPDSSPDTTPVENPQPDVLKEDSSKKKKKKSIDKLTEEGITVEEILNEDTEVSEPETQSPQPDELVTVTEELNNQIADYIDWVRGKFYWYVERKYEGYVGADTNYKILRNDKDIFMIRFDSTINVGGSVNYSRCFVLDKRVNAILKIGDLFVLGSDYIGVISKEVLRQMKERVEQGMRYYYIEGSIYSESDWFRRIAADQNFYINEKNEIVIVFNEYEVASGQAGMPEFVIPKKVVESMIKKKYSFKNNTK